MSRIGLGLAAIGRPGYLTLGREEDLGPDRRVARLRSATWELLDVASALGITYVDAARSYGRAEAFLGGWLAAHPRVAGEVVVGSKWGYTYTAGWRVDAEVHEVKDHGLATLERQWPETTAALGRAPDLYQVHSATLESGVLDRPEVLDTLARLRDRGVLVGVTTSGPDQAVVIDRALDVERGGAPLFGAVQATWNLLERSAEAALVRAHESGRAVLVKEALANGRLTVRAADPDGDATRAVALLVPLADRAGVGVDAIALAAALAMPWATVVLSGAATPEQIRSNVRAAAVDHDTATAACGAVTPAGAQAYWSARRALGWA